MAPEVLCARRSVECMSGLIARASPDFRETGKFRGVFHIHDGWPNRLGKTLYDIYNGVAAPIFRPLSHDVEAMLRYLVDENPTGWKSINVTECLCALRPPGLKLHRCVCTLEPTYPMDTLSPVTERGSSRGARFAYVLDADTAVMHVLTAATRSGRRTFSKLVPETDRVDGWVACDSVDLTAKEPDWDAITFGYPEMQIYRYYMETYARCFPPKRVGLRTTFAYCPNGHGFSESTGYRAGDRCLGSDVPLRYEAGYVSRVSCGHIFKQPQHLRSAPLSATELSDPETLRQSGSAARASASGP